MHSLPVTIIYGYAVGFIKTRCFATDCEDVLELSPPPCAIVKLAAQQCIFSDKSGNRKVDSSEVIGRTFIACMRALGIAVLVSPLSMDFCQSEGPLTRRSEDFSTQFLRWKRDTKVCTKRGNPRRRKFRKKTKKVPVPK